METRDLKRILAGVSVAGLIAAGVTTVATVQNAQAAWTGSTSGAGGAQMQMQAVTLGINGTAVKSMQELQASLDALASGAKVTITYKSKGKDMKIEGVVK